MTADQLSRPLELSPAIGASPTPKRKSMGTRLIALVGPYQSGKTTLLESILARTGAIARQGSVAQRTSVGDYSPEARAHAMSVEPNVAAVDYLGDAYAFIDCPGSIEFSQSMRDSLAFCDAAIVVCETEERKLPVLQTILQELENIGLPHILFLNKIDQTSMRVRETLAMLQSVSRTPLLLRQIPIWQNGIATGFIDLALERAFVYREHAPSEIIDVPAGELPREKTARYSMLERLADYDDALMEELISDIEPPRDQIFSDLARDLRDGHVAPLLIGSAERGHGVTRLLKALRHESPGVADTRKRLGVSDEGPALAQVLRTTHTTHGGKMSFARVLRGAFRDGETIVGSRGGEDRIASLSNVIGQASAKRTEAKEGETLAFGRLDHVATGETFTEAKAGTPAPKLFQRDPLEPAHEVALRVRDRKDEVKLSLALSKLTEEDPTLIFTHDQAHGEMTLAGQGEMHLRVALERLANRYGVRVETKKKTVDYRETIRHAVTTRGRHKKQSGGHGQFGDVLLEVRPLEIIDPAQNDQAINATEAPFQFEEKVHGGVVPRQYFSAIEAGCRDACARGPLGFPVIGVSVVLLDGSYHSVDSSDIAFRLAARAGMSEALEQAGSVLLEPISAVKIFTPSDALARVSAIVTSRRGQILGLARESNQENWDIIQAHIPEAEMNGLIVDIRSATAGVGHYTARFDHRAELVGKQAETIVAARKYEAAN